MQTLLCFLLLVLYPVCYKLSSCGGTSPLAVCNVHRQQDVKMCIYNQGILFRQYSCGVRRYG